MKLHRDLGVTQKTAWFMLHRIREAWAAQPERFAGPVEADETFVGGKERNKVTPGTGCGLLETAARSARHPSSG